MDRLDGKPRSNDGPAAQISVIVNQNFEAIIERIDDYLGNEEGAPLPSRLRSLMAGSFDGDDDPEETEGECGLEDQELVLADLVGAA